MTTPDDIERAVARAVSPLNAKLERMERLWNDLLVKRPSRKTQAKRAGVHPSTLWRREKRAEAKALLRVA